MTLELKVRVSTSSRSTRRSPRTAQTHETTSILYTLGLVDQRHLGLTGGTGAYVGAQGSLQGTIEDSGKVNLDITLQP
jgi:hypothetical protein